MKGSKRN